MLLGYNRVGMNRIKMEFIGRKDYLNKLRKLVNSNGFSFSVIYGRRRVGKNKYVFISRSKFSNFNYENIEKITINQLYDSNIE